MTIYKWNKEKNILLKKTRNISFEQVVMHIEQGDLLDIIKNPNDKKYSHQKILVVLIKNYVYAVPFVEEKGKDEKFLKTIIPSRKLTKKYLGAKS